MVTFKKDPIIFVSICGAAFSSFIAAIASFLPGWRIGGGSGRHFQGATKAVMEYLPQLSFPTRYYGVFQVRGTYTQSIGQLSSQTCDHLFLSSVGTIFKDGIESMVKLVSGSDSCSAEYYGVTNCLMQQIGNRCKNYQLISIGSSLVLMCTFIAILILIIATMVAFLTRPPVTGSLVLGLYSFAIMLMLSTNIAYVILSDMGFHDLSVSQTFPFPDLHYAYYMHVFSIILLCFCATCYGVKVMPLVRSYDPEEEKRKKRARKYGGCRMPDPMRHAKPEFNNIAPAFSHGPAMPSDFFVHPGESHHPGYTQAQSRPPPCRSYPGYAQAQARSNLYPYPGYPQGQRWRSSSSEIEAYRRERPNEYEHSRSGYPRSVG